MTGLNYISSGVRRAKGKEIKLTPLHPSVAIQVAYYKKLMRLIDEMNRSVDYWLRSTYKNNEPLMARDEGGPALRGGGLSGHPHAAPLLAEDDALPSTALTRAIAKLRKQWLDNFDEAADSMAAYFAKAARKRTDAAMKAILKKGGFSVEFKMTRQMQDIVKATTAENVALIKSIPEQYLKNVEGAVMRSVSAGRDLGSLTKELEKNYGVTRRRAALIARSQNNMATSNMTAARQGELGITKARWRHSGGGKHPRPTHLANNGKTYDVKKGWYDPAVKQWIRPGQLPNCRCVSISVIAGFD